MLTLVKSQPIFQWSFSRLKNFYTCPKRHYEIDITKNIKEPKSDALDWGHDVHAAFDRYLAVGTRLPNTMGQYNNIIEPIARLRYKDWTIVSESKMAMNRDFQPRAFFDKDTWVRGVVDATVMKKGAAIAIDWKTGAIKPDYEQLSITAQMIFAKYPAIKRVYTAYQWLPDKVSTREVFRRQDMVKVWNKLIPKVNVMEEAARTQTYPPRPSGLCIRHCPVVHCPYHGKGSPR